MRLLTWRRGLLLSLAAVVTAMVAVNAGSAGSVSHTPLTAKMNKIQRRLLSGFASFELSQAPGSEAAAKQRASRFRPAGFGADCPKRHGTTVKVNQNCLNITDPDLQGRAQAENETSIAANPKGGQLIASYNDYRRGDSTCGPSYSSNGARWADSTLPNNFVRGTAYGGVARQYFQASGDPSVGWDTRGNAYFDCQMFQRGEPTTNNPDQSSGVYVFRSTQTRGASWNFPGRPVVETYTTTGFPFQDKPYMTVDNSTTSRFKNRVYVTWTTFAADGSAIVYEAHSSDYGETFSSPVVVSRSSSLCTYNHGVPTSTSKCNENQYSQPFTAPNGDLYVVYANFNTVNPGASAGDNHYQVLISQSTDGGASFGAPVLVTKYYDLPDCPTYQAGQDPGRSCVPEKGKRQNSVFRATNYPAGGVDPKNPNVVVVTVGSYINRDSTAKNGCKPTGFAENDPLYTGVKKPGACNNKIIVSVSKNRGATFTGTKTNPRKLPVVPQQRGQMRTDQFWQWAAFSPSGKLAVSYFDRQYSNDETTGSSDISLSGSSNFKSFATVRVTSSSMPLPTQFPDTQGNSVFYGDYSGLAVSGNTAYPLWMDTRDPDLFQCGSLGGHPTAPPRLCTGTEPNGLRANDQNIYTRGLAIP